MSLLDQVILFLHKNPNPNDEQLHQWAESKGLNVHEVEAATYKLATIFVKFWMSGRAKEKGFKESQADPKELAMGIKVEMEHTTCPKTSKRIALDHLAELPDYYTRLAKMESKQ